MKFLGAAITGQKETDGRTRKDTGKTSTCHYEARGYPQFPPSVPKRESHSTTMEVMKGHIDLHIPYMKMEAEDRPLLNEYQASSC